MKNSHSIILGDGQKTRYIIRLRTLSSQSSVLTEHSLSFVLILNKMHGSTSPCLQFLAALLWVLEGFGMHFHLHTGVVDPPTAIVPYYTGCLDVGM